MRVTLVEDQVLLREGLAGLFRDAGHDVIGSYGHAKGLTDLVAKQQSDIVVLDIRLPPTHTDEGTRAAAELKAAHPAIGVLLLSQHVETAQGFGERRARGARLPLRRVHLLQPGRKPGIRDGAAALAGTLRDAVVSTAKLADLSRFHESRCGSQLEPKPPGGDGGF